MVAFAFSPASLFHTLNQPPLSGCRLVHYLFSLFPRRRPMNRTVATERILAAKLEKKLTFGAIAKAVGRHPVWVTSALLGQSTMSPDEAQKAVGVLGLGAE